MFTPPFCTESVYALIRLRLLHVLVDRKRQDYSNLQAFAVASEDKDPFRPWFWRKFLASVVILFGHLTILSHRCWLQAQKPSSFVTILSIMHRIGNPERKRPDRKSTRLNSSH